MELEDRKLRIEDAENGTFAAIEEGIVPGGGAAFVHLSACVPGLKDKLEEADECLGADIVQKALVAPAALIAHNAGVEGEVVAEKIKDSEWEVGHNAMTDKYEMCAAECCISCWNGPNNTSCCIRPLLWRSPNQRHRWLHDLRVVLPSKHSALFGLPVLG